MTPIDIARLSAWLVVAVYVVAVIQEFRRSSVTVRRSTWTAGAIALVGHIVWTLFAIHHGSLAEAFAHTAQKTEQFVGLRIGAGLYANFAMLAFWLGDATAWWVVPSWDNIRRKYILLMHAAFSFMSLNAAVVFASPWGRMFGIAALLITILSAYIAWKYPASRGRPLRDAKID